MKKIILILLAGLCFQPAAFSQQKANFEEKLIGSTFKSLAKAFVAVTDIGKLKKKNIEKLGKMSEAKFKKQQVKIYPVLCELPPGIKAEYGINDLMDKARVISNINSLDKNKIYKIIDGVPDSVITRLFMQELQKAKQEMAKSDLAGQVRKFWDKITQKASVE